MGECLGVIKGETGSSDGGRRCVALVGDLGRLRYRLLQRSISHNTWTVDTDVGCAGQRLDGEASLRGGAWGLGYDWFFKFWLRT